MMGLGIKAMTSVKKSPKEAKKARAASAKTGPKKGDPDPTKGERKDKDGKRRRKRRRGASKPRNGRLDTEFTKVKAVEFYKAVFAAVDASPPPWSPKNQRVGRSNIDPKALTKCVIVMVEDKKSYRDMVSYLHSRPDLLKLMGLESVPSKSTLCRAMRRIPQRYLRKVSSAVLDAVPEPRDGVKKTTIP